MDSFSTVPWVALGQNSDQLAVLTLGDFLTVGTPYKDGSSLGNKLSGARESGLLFALNPQLCDVGFRLFARGTASYQKRSEQKE